MVIWLYLVGVLWYMGQVFWYLGSWVLFWFFGVSWLVGGGQCFGVECDCDVIVNIWYEFVYVKIGVFNYGVYCEVDGFFFGYWMFVYLCDINCQSGGFGDVFDGQVVGDFQLVFVGLFDCSVFEGGLWEFFCVEEICIQKVFVVVGLEGVEVVDVDGEFDGGVCWGVFIDY